MRKFFEAAIQGLDPEACEIMLKNMIQYELNHPGWFYSNDPVEGVTQSKAGNALLVAVKAATVVK